jgi:Flp pilus assembly protein TadG
MLYRISQKGAAVVEFALILPLLVLLLFGIIEFSAIMYDKQMITNASREGARRGIVYQADPNTGNYSPALDQTIYDTIDAYLFDNTKTPPKSFLLSFKPGASFQRSVSPPWSARQANGSGSSLTVTVTYQYNFFLVPDLSELFFRLFLQSDSNLPSGIPLRSETVMRME